MKVVIVDSYFSVVDVELQRALEGAGLDTWIISSDLRHIQYRGGNIKFDGSNYKHVTIRSYESPILGLNLYFPFPIHMGLIETLKTMNADIVHTSEHVSAPSFWCNFNKKNWKTVLIERAGSWEGIMPKFRIHEYLAKKFIFPNVDMFAALSTYAADTLRSFGIRKEITITPNPVDIGKFSIITPWNERKNVILYVGRLSKIRVVDYMIRAIPIARKKIPDIELWLVGDGEDRNYYMSLASGKDYIKFLGNRSRSELPHLYNQAKGFVMLSKIKATGIGLAAEEAMASGVPIIGSNGIPFDEEKAIYYFTGDLEIDRIAEDMVRCIHEGDSYAKKARYVAETNYSHRAVGTNYKKMVEQFLTKN